MSDATRELVMESCLLGAILQKPECFAEIAPLLRPGVFTDQRNKLVFEAMTDIDEAGQAVEIGTVYEQLRIKGLLDQVDAGYIAQLVDAPPYPEHARTYALRLRDAEHRRGYASLGKRLEVAAQDGTNSVADLSDMIREHLTRYSAADTRGTYDMAALLGVVDTPTETFSLGIDWLTSFIGMVEPGSMGIPAGAPRTGKTALMLQMALGMAVSGTSVSFLSAEMGPRLIMLRLLSQHSRIPFGHIRDKTLSEDESRRLEASRAAIASLPIRVVYIPGATPDRALAVGREEYRHSRVVMLDYVQLLRAGGERRDEVDQVSGGFKALAGEHNGLSILASQLRRLPAESGNRRPQLSDLKESGGLEQDADFVLLLWRDPKQQNEGAVVRPVMLYLAKNRNGESDVEADGIGFYGPCLRFERIETRQRGPSSNVDDDPLGVRG
jgi:replicative DNA helicase